MLKFRHVRHPIFSARAVKERLAARLELRGVAERGERRYGGDPRYDLENVTNGFADHSADLTDDGDQIWRICQAYRKAITQQEAEPPEYRASRWWEEVRERGLRPVMQALRRCDIDGLRAMYRTFFRDTCSTGLIGVPYGMSDVYFAETIPDVHRRYYMADVLHRVDYWRSVTNGRFETSALAAPKIGNPFGAIVEGTLVDAGAPARHYHAHRITELLDQSTGTVVEIGGGFGGTAYYLLRGRPRVRYIGFDIPESIALTSYYLMTAFPQLTFSLYEESETIEHAIADCDIVLMPSFELSRMPARSVDVVFSSHAMSDFSESALATYLNHISRVTRKAFLYVGVESAGEAAPGLTHRNHRSLKLVDTRRGEWHQHRSSHPHDIELTYAADLDSARPHNESAIHNRDGTLCRLSGAAVKD